MTALKVLILGGTGVFGARLARLLIADGWVPTVTSRSAATAETFVAQFGGRPLALDRADDLQPVFANYDVVVDAAGPFQDYGSDRYRVACAALAAGAHYLDLSDDAGFTAGITALDDAARRADRVALSGVSSVPALSAAAVAALGADMDRISHIESAILPGNRAPRGASVMRAILGQVGAPLQVWRQGRWQTLRGWSDRRDYRLAPDLRRSAMLIGAPDLTLFPEYFNAETVEFRAGLELGVMQHALATLSWLRGHGLCPNLARFTPAFRLAAGMLMRFGSDRGGMVVEVEGRSNGSQLRRRWTLLAEAGDGPFIPAIPARIVLDKLASNALPSGARPGLGLFSLQEAEKVLSRLRVVTRQDGLALDK